VFALAGKIGLAHVTGQRFDGGGKCAELHSDGLGVLPHKTTVEEGGADIPYFVRFNGD
jgi:hypothetical protein